MRNPKEIEKEYTKAMKNDEGNGTQFIPFYAKANPCLYNLKQIYLNYAFNRIIDEIPRTSKMLEIGCCTGRLTFKLGVAGYNVIGIDCVNEAIEEAKKYKKDFPKEIQERIKFKHGFIEKLPFADSSQDIVVATEVLEHVEDIEIAIKEIFRVLKLQGKFIFTVPYKDRIKSPHHIHNLGMVNIAKLLDPYIVGLYMDLIYYPNRNCYGNIFGIARKGNRTYL